MKDKNVIFLLYYTFAFKMLTATKSQYLDTLVDGY